MDKPVVIETNKYEDFRGWLSVPLDKEIDFRVVQINQGYSKKSSHCVAYITRKVNTHKLSWCPACMEKFSMLRWI